MKYAKWRRRTHVFRKDDYACSGCGFATRIPRNICPGCGAAMRGRFVKPARWTRRTHLFSADQYVCSVCGAVSRKAFKTCPNCGSLMKKTKYDPHWVDEIENADAFLD